MRQVEYIPKDNLFYKGMFVTVVGNIMMDGRSAYSIIDSNGVVGGATEEELEGIPLTEEILNKNGWCKNSEGSYCYHSCDGCINIGPNQFEDIQYVHQLQHLLFAFGFSMDLKI